MGDAREAEKNGQLYADHGVRRCEMEFGAIVLYTYGGFHASALTPSSNTWPRPWTLPRLASRHPSQWSQVVSSCPAHGQARVA